MSEPLFITVQMNAPGLSKPSIWRLTKQENGEVRIHFGDFLVENDHFEEFADLDHFITIPAKAIDDFVKGLRGQE